MSYDSKNPYGSTPNINLNPADFNKLIAQHGIRIKIEKTTVCPNYIGNVDSLHHSMNCTLCENGFVHYGNTECWGVFQQNALTRLFLREGTFDPGQALLNVPTHDENGVPIVLSYFDRITLLDQTERFYELMNKSRAPVDLLRYKALEVLYCIDRRGTVYTEGKEFKLDENSNILWLDDQPKPVFNADEGIGESFSISYYFRPVYRVLDLIHEGRYSQKVVDNYKHTTSFPQLVLLKKDYYVTKKDINGLPFRPAVDEQEYNHNTIEEPIE